ncbi:3-oxoacyl-ACP synthase III family protein [Streptoalloteichus hindustanus]|uniref:3-oxoacyl-[acyl-carrier-protein] synthase-3 n=1 Tax=Streptoalloteichus hindustanus TaxID=2017 RepID=A0A1M4YQZ4_STRHI|nr:ketoacyl-ACP synthase III [Streptoalloteichus hindustanus]SHF08077.1 3-oxoacyl-[acyl-carrier-protein] synthase-3 [Streptoalloteichus hindustanus]
MSPSGRHSRLVDVAVHLPGRGPTTSEVEDRLAELNPGLDLPRGLIQRFTGVRRRHVAPEDWRASDLAVAAAEKLLAATGRAVADLDLIIFAATSGDVVEPATAHPVAAKLGARCPVFDLRNACNSVLNAVEVADGLIRSGSHRRVLVACGEWLSCAAQWTVGSAEEYVHACASHTLSDAGAALLVEESDEPGILGHRFSAESSAWRTMAVPLPMRGTELPNTPPEGPRFRVRALELLAALDAADLGAITGLVADLGFAMADFAAVCVHQAALPYLPTFCERVGIPLERTVVTIADHGNVGAASLPLQLALAVESGRVRRGDPVALVGLASGLSLGAVVLRW